MASASIAARQVGISTDREELAADMLDQFKRQQLLYVPRAFAPDSSVEEVLKLLHTWVSPSAGSSGGLAAPNAAQCASVADTWNVEHGTGATLRSPQKLLSALVSALSTEKGRTNRGRTTEKGVAAGGRWYASCVVQHCPRAIERFFACLPCGGSPPFTLEEPRKASGGKRKKTVDTTTAKVREEFENAQCAWVFIGQNVPGAGAGAVEVMQGRPEHTDAIAHSGTWHMQLAGSKVWHLRPNPTASWDKGADLEAAMALVAKHGVRTDGSDTQRLHVACQAGDLLLVNTRLWFHSTEIPSTALPEAQAVEAGKLPLSVSVARDFYVGRDAKERAAEHRAGVIGEGGGADVDMTNVDASWALGDIDCEDVVLTDEPLLAVQEVLNRREIICCERVPPGTKERLLEHLCRRKSLRCPVSEAEEELGQVQPVITGGGLVFCSNECAQSSAGIACCMLRSISSNEPPLNVVRQRRLLHSLSSGHFSTFELVGQYFIRTLVEASGIRSCRNSGWDLEFEQAEDGVADACASVQAMGAADTGAWWEVVAEAEISDEEGEGSEDEDGEEEGPEDGGSRCVYTAQLHRVRNEESGWGEDGGGGGGRGKRRKTLVVEGGAGGREEAYGIKLAERGGKVFVEDVIEGGSGWGVVRVGDEVKGVGETEVESVADFRQALVKGEAWAEELSGSTFGNHLPSVWVAMDMTFSREYPGKLNKAEQEAWHRKVRRQDAEKHLKTVARRAWLLLLELLDQGFVIKGPLGTGLHDIVTFERFSMVLARLHEVRSRTNNKYSPILCSNWESEFDTEVYVYWDVGGSSQLFVPSHLARYADSCLSSLSRDFRTASAAVAVFKEFLHGVATKGGVGRKANGKKRIKAEEMEAAHVLESARDSVPSLLTVAADEEANCDVVLEGPSLKVLVVATEGIQAGQQLCLPAGLFSD